MYREDNTPLHDAADEGNNEAVLSLIQKKAKVNSQNKFGSSPLHFASKRGHNDVVKSLCQARANVHAKTWDMRTPLHDAAMNGHLDVVITLIQYGADVNAQNKYGKSVLHYAAEGGKMEVVISLINRGADMHTKDSNGETAFEVASDNVKKYFHAIQQNEIPREIVELGPEAVIQFLKAREKGSYRSNIIRCMVVGHFGVGKTTLVRKLMNRSGTVRSTNGIEVHIGKCNYDANTKEWVTQEKHTELILGIENISQIHFWDFGGQLIFYTTHQSYLSRRGLYLLVFDLSMGLHGEVQDEDLDPISRNRRTVIDYLEFWIGSIRLYGRSKFDSFPKILLIGTHKDRVKALQNKEVDDSFLSPIVRQMEVYDEFIDAVADQMSATYFQTGIELGMSLGEIKQLRVSHQCSAPRIVREMLRLWLKRNGSNKETLIGSLASALLHTQENIAVLMDLEGKAVIQHLCKKELRRQSSQECSIS